jgi:hypothetical protein
MAARQTQLHLMIPNPGRGAVEDWPMTKQKVCLKGLSQLMYWQYVLADWKMAVHCHQSDY